ncbi:S1/P1 nuclease [Sphingomonas sp. KRR8]|uniref:S1/P1 nuclease n=1 Tax=Sphingomonas sp. KRR8 TaxID=2942996 RepID=UPI002021BF1A|nr:S1/P1 nuclease [Sphingomonas sp. KRR8]URD60115.1 S1/P1 nuclease [Sphingomonas sp. KRR8]
MPIIRLLAALCALVAAAPSAAYWEYGHETVAAVAWQSVRPETRARIEALLRQGRLLETPTCPVTTIEQASVWADCIKPLGDRFSYQSSWHYQNVNICKPFSLREACKDGNCLSAQIDRNARLLADKTLPVRERLMALAYLVHFVGDMSQPMHGGDRADKGGNDVPVTYGTIAGKTNLHSIWDGWLPERAITAGPNARPGNANDANFAGRARELLGEVPPAERPTLAAGTTEDWSRQTWANARTYAYTTLLGDPCAPIPAERPLMTEAKIQSLIVPIRRQVVTGGLRLARLLDDALLYGKAPQRPQRSPAS